MSNTINKMLEILDEAKTFKVRAKLKNIYTTHPHGARFIDGMSSEFPGAKICHHETMHAHAKHADALIKRHHPGWSVQDAYNAGADGREAYLDSFVDKDGNQVHDSHDRARRAADIRLMKNGVHRDLINAGNRATDFHWGGD